MKSEYQKRYNKLSINNAIFGKPNKKTIKFYWVVLIIILVLSFIL